MLRWRPGAADISLPTKFTCLDQWIVIKSEPAIEIAIVAEVFFLPIYHFQGKVIIGHNPEGIGVGMGGEEITQVNGCLSL